MKSLCLFASHFKQEQLPYYVVIYLKELKKHCSDVLLLCHSVLSQYDLAVLSDLSVEYQKEKNEGYDFGLWYKALTSRNVEEYDRIILVNDSCIVFKPLDAFFSWTATEEAEAYGMTASDAVEPHLQSYFLVFGKKAIPHVLSYFNEHKLQADLNRVIHVYEIGLSRYLREKGMRLKRFVDNNSYSGEFSPYYFCIKYHLRMGMPLIKKKILFCSYRPDELFNLARMNFRISPAVYFRILEQDKDLILDLEQLRSDTAESLGVFKRFYYLLLRWTIVFVHLLRGQKRVMPE